MSYNIKIVSLYFSSKNNNAINVSREENYYFLIF